MNFNFQRHLRLAGSVAAIAGLLLHNWIVVIFGWFIVFVGYSLTISKIEAYIEATSEPEEDEDAVR